MTTQKLTLDIVKRSLLDANDNINEACKIANVKYQTFYYLVKKYNIDYISEKRIDATKEQLENTFRKI